MLIGKSVFVNGVVLFVFEWIILLKKWKLLMKCECIICINIIEIDVVDNI